MRPLKLALKNFKSYGENVPVLDFSRFDVVLLTGENGNGKSSLADAIAWCLWGQCKGMDRRGGVDDLVRMGSEEMEVVFDFEEDGNRYRVIRKRSRRLRQSMLELRVLRNGEYVSMGGSRIDETQAAILDILKLDYDTYLCTSYLSQGKADMFAAKRPGERKEILAEILDLSSYEKLEQRAAQHRSGLQSQLELLKREIELLTEQAGMEKEVKSQLQRVEETLKDCQNRENEAREELERLRKHQTARQAIFERIKLHQDELTRERENIERLNRESLKLKTRIQEYQSILQREEEVQEGFQRYQQLRQEERDLLNKLQKATELERSKDRLEREVQARKADLTRQKEILENQIHVLTQQTEGLEEMKKRCQTINETLRKSSELKIELSRMDGTINKKMQERFSLEKEIHIKMHRLHEMEEHQKGLEHINAECPFCGIPLNDSHREQLMMELADEKEMIKRQSEEARNRMQVLDIKCQKLEEQIQNIQASLRKAESLEMELKQLTKQIDERENVLLQISAIRPRLDLLKKELEDEGSAKELIDEIRAIEEKITSLGYDPEHHQRVSMQMEDLKVYVHEREEISHAKARLASDREALLRFIGLIEERSKHLKELEGLIHDLKQSAYELPDMNLQMNDMQQEIKANQETIRNLEARKGALGENWRRIREAALGLEVKQQERRHLEHHLEIYRNLVMIYGKKGIQAALIENAIPELQQEANRVLANISDGRLMVEFSTHRDTLSGNVMETLDIKISDEMGTRKYETYSGGEEFRINFAIRVAMAKILARRSGANISMLILDEGFGVLDEEGRERLVEVINGIRDEFEKIMVITHIKDLKDAFPNQLEVFKTPEGSTFRWSGAL